MECNGCLITWTIQYNVKLEYKVRMRENSSYHICSDTLTQAEKTWNDK